MRKLFYAGLGLVLILYLLPAVYQIMGRGDKLAIDFETLDLPGAVPASQTPEASPGAAQDETGDADAPLDYSSITVSIDGKPETLSLESYVAGVTAAEIDDEFPEEAIRAQAVAARTYAVYKIFRGRPDAHPDADVCDDFHHCAAYRADAAEASTGGGLTRVQQAVKDTAGQILTYNDEPIAAVFHCASGPRTETATDVWGGDDIPYLQSVVSPGGSACEKYEGTVKVTADEFREKVKAAFPTADVSGKPKSWFKASVRSEAGGIETIKLGGVTVEGTAVRELFGLNSTNFTVTTDEDAITFHTIGYGHGVGLSQYGAKYLAEQGEDFEKILTHYYPGTSLTQI